MSPHLALVAAALVAAPSAPSEQPGPRFRIWTYPLQIVAGMAQRERGASVIPLGASFRAGDMELFASLSFISGEFESNQSRMDYRSQTAVLAEAGRTFRRQVTPYLSFWWAPKAYYAFVREAEWGESAWPATRENPRQLGPAHVAHVGADVGVDLTFGPASVSVLAGLSAGVCTGCENRFFSPVITHVDVSVYHAAGLNPALRPSFSVNANLLRLGAQF